MTQDQLIRIGHYLWILDTYLFVSKHPKREEQMQEIAELQRAIMNELKR